MLAWVMNMGFAASPAGAAPTSKYVPEQYLGLSMMKLGGRIFTLTLLVSYLGGWTHGK